MTARAVPICRDEAGLTQQERETFRHDAGSPDGTSATASIADVEALSAEMLLLRAQCWQVPPDLDLNGHPELLLAAVRRVD